MKKDRLENAHTENDNKNNEPKVENDYKDRTEIQSPNPSTATPFIPAELPVRQFPF